MLPVLMAAYVVDMYRGIVQEQIYWTDSSATTSGTGPEKRCIGPHCGSCHHDQARSDAGAVEGFAGGAGEDASHPNGWWRDTAQRVMVERGDASVAHAAKAGGAGH